MGGNRLFSFPQASEALIKISAGKDLINSFPEADMLNNNTIVWHAEKFFLFPFLCQKQEGGFLQHSLWEPGRASGGKTLHKCGSIPAVGAPWGFCLSDMPSLHLQQFVKCTSGFPVPALISAEASILVGSCSLYSSVCLPNLEVGWGRMGSSLLCYLISFIRLRKVHNFFNLFSVSLVVRME